jgi:hypothetical protein
MQQDYRIFELKIVVRQNNRDAASILLSSLPVRSVINISGSRMITSAAAARSPIGKGQMQLYPGNYALALFPPLAASGASSISLCRISR